MTITNKYLKKSIGEMSNFLTNKAPLPEDMLFNFVMELRVSNLLIPAKVKDSRISFPHLIGENAVRLLPLFTDDDEFSKYTTDLDAIPNEFEYYQHLVNNLEFDGIVINCEGEDFIIDRELANSIPPFEEMESEGLKAEELKEIASSAENEELLSYVRDDANFNRQEGLADILMRSYPLGLVMSDEDFSDYAHDGIVKRTDLGGFVPVKHRIGREEYPALFTSADAAGNYIRDGPYHYCIQVSNLYEIIRFALTNDLDGIIINPGLEEYRIPRHALIMMLSEEDFMNPDLANSIDYAFEF